MTFARWGIPCFLWTTAVLVWGLWVVPGVWPKVAVAVVGGFCWGFVLNFFRNPRRHPPAGEHLLVSAADGVIADIEEVDEPKVIKGKAIRIGVFMNVFDVHVNRASISGRIMWTQYKPGKFLDVRHPDCTHQNEALDLGVQVDPAIRQDTRLLLRQISGWIARRIVCTHDVGDDLQRGEVFGMIKFGSRVEHYLPVESGTVQVSVGQRVKAGESVLWDFSKASDAQPALEAEVNEAPSDQAE